MYIRRYVSSDREELTRLFYQTVHSINAKDYSSEQLAVWAPEDIDLEKWDKSFLEHDTVVAVEDGALVGFGDIDRSGYLDRLYVHKDYQNQGVAAAICDELEKLAGSGAIITHASITAKPFFEHRGYKVLKEQQVIRRGISLTNYVMKK